MAPPGPGAGRSAGDEHPPRYRGFFINLDRSVERRASMEGQLGRHGLADTYSRFPAIDGRQLQPIASLDAAEIACFHSHCAALQRAREHGGSTHIMEDDIVLSEHVARTIDSIQSNGVLDQYDIVFTETFIGSDVPNLRSYRQLFNQLHEGGASRREATEFVVLDLAGIYLGGMSSYVVGARALDRVISTCTAELERGPTKPIDLFVREEAEAGRLKLGCLFPFVTTITLESAAQSTIRGPSLSVLAFSLLRYSFFVNRDLTGHAAPFIDELRRARAAREHDAHDRLITEVLSLAASSDFVQF